MGNLATVNRLAAPPDDALAGQREASWSSSKKEMIGSELASLLAIGQAFTGSLRFKSSIVHALEVLERQHGVMRSWVTVLQDGTKEILIEASSEAHPEQSVRYRVGEGVTGRVVETGKPVVVPRASREPMMLNRAADRSPSDTEVTFISVPIVINGKTMGSLNVDLPFDADRDYDRAQTFFGVVASMIGQALKINRLVDGERQRLLAENIHLREELRERYDFSNLIGNSGPMRQVYEKVTQVARGNTTVMIRGESGTGKELIAHAIHYNSPRKNKPFIKVNCAALPETLIESELFGYEKGAFTGATMQKKGRFELAEGGTLFLDEIGELNASTSVKLLRVLQEREFERLGGTTTLRADVRLIVATNKDLEKAIAAGSYREDLYYRLNVFTIFVPPLRERKTDIMLLAEHFLSKYAAEHGKEIRRMSTPAIDMLCSYHWPGNVRELENTIERAVIVCDGSAIHGHHLPPTLQTAEATGTTMSVSLKEATDSYEKDIIMDTLKTTRGNRSKCATLLHTTERIVNYKIAKYKIDCERFRQ